MDYYKQREMEQKKLYEQVELKRASALQQLKKIITSQGHTWKLEDTNVLGDFHVDINGTSVLLELQAEQVNLGTVSRPYTGKLRIIVPVVFGSKKQFPEPKLGFDYNKIAAAILDYVQKTQVKDLQDDQRSKIYNERKAIVDKLNKKFATCCLSVNYRTNTVQIELDNNLTTEDHVRSILHFCKSLDNKTHE